MIILGIILVILGFVVMMWSSKAAGEGPLGRPLAFNNPVFVVFVILLWLGLLAAGFYLIWQTSYIIALVSIGVFILFWLFGLYMGREKVQAKRIFKIYKKLKLFRPNATDDELYQETAKLYYRQLRKDEREIKSIFEIIFPRTDSDFGKFEDVKRLANMLLAMENPSVGSGFDYQKHFKRFDKRERVVEAAYKSIFGKQPNFTEKPVLSDETLSRLEDLGLEPNEMSDEQLAALESLENPKKSHWLAKPFMFIGFGCAAMAFFSLIYREWESVLFYGIPGLVLSYIGYRIQSRIASKKFIQASIEKYAQEQKEKT
jgi:Ca2+/Na+ antiporter